MKVALVCVAKNEDPYIDEWILYNKKLGFDDIFIYQNDWDWSGEYENVHKLRIDGANQQLKSYNDFISNYHTKYDWAAFFDIDEFLVLKKHGDIKSFLSDYKEFQAVGINWVLFGNNGHVSVDGEYSVIKRFTKRQTDVNTHVKCIVKLSQDVKMSIHNPHCEWVDTHKKINNGPFSITPSDEIAQLNHYFCKTQEEFRLKCERGRADSYSTRTMDEFEPHNPNDIEDLTAYNFFFK